MQEINGPFIADTITANSISVSDLTAGNTTIKSGEITLNDTIIGKTVTLSSQEGTIQHPIKYSFIDCNVIFNGMLIGEIDISFTNCNLTSANGSQPDIYGLASDDDSKTNVYFYGCSGTIKIGAVIPQLAGDFYVYNSPNLSIERFDYSYQHCNLFVDGVKELYNRNSPYSSINGINFTWTTLDGTPASYSASGLSPGYKFAMILPERIYDCRRIIIHYLASTLVGFMESEIVCDVDGDYGSLGFKRGNIIPYQSGAGTTQLLFVSIGQQGNTISFYGAMWNDASLPDVYITAIRGIL